MLTCSHAHMLTTFFWCFLTILLFWGIFGGFGGLQPQKNFAGDPQIFLEIALAKK